MPTRDEKQILEKILSAFPKGHARIGIGDDAAVLDLGVGTVVTTDALVEDVDFTRQIPLEFVAAKCLAVNLSDLAAMGATPHSFTVTLAAPDWMLEKIDAFIEGLAAAAAQHEVELVGGDLSRSALGFVSITAIGRLPGRPLLRSGAQPGDRVFLSREVGGSASGLALLGRGWGIEPTGSVIVPDDGQPSFEQRAFAESAIRQQVDPRPECALGPKLAADDSVHACIDVSDGLSSDLGRICEASSVGAVVEWERVPLFGGLDIVGRGLVDPDFATLHGGEELALLFTADARESELSSRFGRPVYQIGVITSDKSVFLEKEGKVKPLEPMGFDHFRSE